jgi:ABC-2 type transport system ATP-binding protein
MSILVKGLTKTFGSQIAVNNIHFSVKPGEIVGFLGPNGAGKSTTMKMLCCYLKPTDGSAEIDGFDILENPLEVKSRVGYLAEQNPLYDEMYVKEYLAFVAGIHKILQPKQRISEVIHLTGLEKEQNKIIGSLSKGYKQRVGLAQAIIHDPKVLILDEPTSGLDMNQLAGIRQLILEMGKEKTVIFSSHIMQEVQALCSRVVIINDGILVADDPIEKLQSGMTGQGKIIVDFAETDININAFKKLKGVVDVTREGNSIHIVVNEDTDIKPEIFRQAVALGLTIIEMRSEKINMESVFRKLTKTGKE